MAIENNLLDNTKPLARQSVSSSIFNMIFDNIMDGHLRPGDKLPTESEFVEKLGVGRNSVREALKVLTFLGIVQIKRGSGTFVSDSMSSSVLEPLILSLALDQQTPHHLIELRMLLEKGVAELVIDKASDEDIAKLEEANNKLKRAAKQNTHEQHVLRDLDLNIHFTMFQITNNPFVEKVARAIYKLFAASIEETVEFDPYQAYKNHQLYIKAIKDRDKEKTKENIEKAFAFWIKYIER